MPAKFAILYLSILVLAMGCDTQKDNPPQTEDFSCIKIFDELGLGLGLHGSCTTSPDWGQITLNASEQALLNFADTVSLNGTTATTISQISVFPCPVTLGASQAIHLFGELPNTPVKLKIAIVDESLNVVWQLAVRTATNSGLHLMISNDQFETGKYYRMYYRVSATGAPNLLEGYGNFLVCKTHINGVTTTIESDCM